MENVLIQFSTPNITLSLFVAVLLLLFISLLLSRKIHNLTKGESGKSFEQVIRKYLNSVDELKKENEIISKYLIDIEKRLSQSIRNVSTVRYKAFEQNSSNQSFAIAFLNENGDGVVISSLHLRNSTNIFAKPVFKYSSEHELTEEELQVLEESKEANKRKNKIEEDEKE